MSTKALGDFIVWVVTLSFMAASVVFSVEKLCLFHQTYTSMSSKLEGEMWLLNQCHDPVFFSNLQQHLDMCFVVDCNNKVGAFMLALNEFTGSFHVETSVFQAWKDLKSFSWPLIGALLLTMLLSPAFIVRGMKCASPPAYQIYDPHCRSV